MTISDLSGQSNARILRLVGLLCDGARHFDRRYLTQKFGAGRAAFEAVLLRDDIREPVRLPLSGARERRNLESSLVYEVSADESGIWRQLLDLTAQAKQIDLETERLHIGAITKPG